MHEALVLTAVVAFTGLFGYTICKMVGHAIEAVLDLVF